MIEELLAFAREAYGQLTALLGACFLEKVHVTDVLTTVQMRLAFLKRHEEDACFLQLPVNEQSWIDYFHYDLGYGVISHCYLVDMPGLLAAARKRMQERGILREQRFERRDLVVGDGPGRKLAGGLAAGAFGP